MLANDVETLSDSRFSLTDMELVNAVAKLRDLASNIGAEDGGVLEAKDISVLQNPVDRVDSNINGLDHNLVLPWRRIWRVRDCQRSFLGSELPGGDIPGLAGDEAIHAALPLSRVRVDECCLGECMR